MFFLFLHSGSWVKGLHFSRKEDQPCCMWFSTQSGLVDKQACECWATSTRNANGVQPPQLFGHLCPEEPFSSPPPFLRPVLSINCYVWSGTFYGWEGHERECYGVGPAQRCTCFFSESKYKSTHCAFIHVFLSTPVHMHGGLICITLRPSVCGLTKIQTRN